MRNEHHCGKAVDNSKSYIMMLYSRSIMNVEQFVSKLNTLKESVASVMGACESVYSPTLYNNILELEKKTYIFR